MLLKRSHFWGGSLARCTGHLGAAPRAQMGSARQGLAGHPTPKSMPTLRQPSLLCSRRAITPLAALTGAVTSRETGRCLGFLHCS